MEPQDIFPALLRAKGLLEEETGEELVIRVYEITGVQTTGRIRISGLKCAELSDMAENKGRHLECQGDCFTVEFKPFEIKTIRVKR